MAVNIYSVENHWFGLILYKLNRGSMPRKGMSSPLRCSFAGRCAIVGDKGEDLSGGSAGNDDNGK